MAAFPLLALLSLVFGRSLATSPAVVAVFAPPHARVNISHVVLDRDSQRVYLGADNWLFQLSADLALEASVATGPVRDSPACSPSDCGCVEEVVPLVTNVNKLLALDNFNQRLIACGSVRQGSCQRLALKDIGARDQQQTVAVPVAANDQHSSTAALALPAHFGPDFGSQHVLYVAATNTRLGAYRDMVPAVSARYLEPGARLLHVVERALDVARVDIASHLRDYFLVRYVCSFASRDFVYFGLVQRRSHLHALEEWGFLSRLARVCRSDAAFNTYAETTLRCRAPDNPNDEFKLLQAAALVPVGRELAASLGLEPGAQVLFGVFSSALEHSSWAGARSALCLFALNEIEEKFTQNIHLCYNGSVRTRDMHYIAGNVPDCPAAGQGGNIVSFCAETLKLNGSLAIESTAAAVFDNCTLTAVQAVQTGQHTVALVGTRAGRLKKLLVSRADLAEEFDELEVDAGHALLPDMAVDKEGQHVLVASPRKISKIAIERCGHYTSCDHCLQARNPFCGWCSLRKSCTLRAECRDNRTSSSSRWLSLDEQCIDFQSIRPESLAITSTDKVELVINQLPKLPQNANYQCVFGAGPPIDAQTTKTGLICRTPPVAWRPPAPSGSDHVLVDLSVRSSETKSLLLRRKFAFFDCNAHKNCRHCVQSQWQCNWCSHLNKCTDIKHKCSPNHNLVSEDVSKDMLASSAAVSAISDQKLCPSVDLKRNSLLPDGVTKKIILPANNMPESNYKVAKDSELSPVAIVVITVWSLALVLFVLISVAMMRHKSPPAELEY